MTYFKKQVDLIFVRAHSQNLYTAISVDNLATREHIFRILWFET